LEIANAVLVKDGRWTYEFAEAYAASLCAEVARLKALLNYDGQRYESCSK